MINAIKRKMRSKNIDKIVLGIAAPFQYASGINHKQKWQPVSPGTLTYYNPADYTVRIYNKDKKKKYSNQCRDILLTTNNKGEVLGCLICFDKLTQICYIPASQFPPE